jgi:DNA-binding FadR family transcriptional regulator
MEQFGVSRPTLREAFRVLESEALISVRRGAHGGARVHTPDGDAAARYAGLVLEHRAATTADVYTAHTLLEPPCARLLAARADPAALARLHAAHQRAAAALDAPRPDPAAVAARHADFHARLVEAAGNQTLTVLAAMLRRILDDAAAGHPLPTPDTPTPERGAHDHHDAHARLLHLLAAGDADAAEAHWRAHVTPAHPPDPTPLLDLLGA